MKKHHIIFSTLVLLSALVINGCLSSEFKIYKLNLNKDFSGNGSIKWVNILSQKSEDPKDYDSDFKEIIDDYLNGSKLEDELPNIVITEKKLFEEDGKLCGQIEFTFKSVDQLKFYRFDEESPTMYYISSMNETFISTNGKYDESIMPVVFWDKKYKNITLQTSLSGKLAIDDTNYVSLLKHYKKWEKKKNNKL
jgi:hypothetical protein